MSSISRLAICSESVELRVLRAHQSSHLAIHLVALTLPQRERVVFSQSLSGATRLGPDSTCWDSVFGRSACHGNVFLALSIQGNSGT